ncbi:MAG: bifunctional hydroxymethylpyrimidine kinase/phosphomethylpyrimidine kinase [Syntrophotaleaceae bacterium]
MISSSQNRLRGLYVITDESRGQFLFDKVEAALQGGARIIQYRAKERDENQRLREARQLGQLCRRSGALFIVNDDPHLALASGADGVHIGRQDGTVAAARALLGPDRIIGTSNRTVEQALASEKAGADYVAVGSIYPTATKQDAVHIGLETLRRVRSAVRLPLVAIGGIDCNGAGPVIDAGADAIAVISAVMGDPAPHIAAREFSLLFNRRDPWPRGRVLTIAGSDSGGGAGIQADLKTITLLGSYGMSTITALTAQNSLGVHGIHPVPVDFVAAQIEAVLSDLTPDVIKTGMLFSAEIASLVGRIIGEKGLTAVIDPVMIAKGGAALLREEALEAVRRDLIPVSYLLTPNVPEAEALTGLTIDSESAMEGAAHRLREMGARNVLLKGGHRTGDAVDLLLEGDTLQKLSAPRIASRHTHGTGCTLAAAVAALLARGLTLVDAVKSAKAYISAGIETAREMGSGHGPVNHFLAGRRFWQEKIQ